MRKKSQKEGFALLWKDLLDLGVASSLAFSRKSKGEKMALGELRVSLLRQSEEHWQGLYKALKRLR